MAVTVWFFQSQEFDFTITWIVLFWTSSHRYFGQFILLIICVTNLEGLKPNWDIPS